MEHRNGIYIPKGNWIQILQIIKCTDIIMFQNGSLIVIEKDQF